MQIDRRLAASGELNESSPSECSASRSFLPLLLGEHGYHVFRAIQCCALCTRHASLSGSRNNFFPFGAYKVPLSSTPISPIMFAPVVRLRLPSAHQATTSAPLVITVGFASHHSPRGVDKRVASASLSFITSNSARSLLATHSINAVHKALSFPSAIQARH